MTKMETTMMALHNHHSRLCIITYIHRPTEYIENIFVDIFLMKIYRTHETSSSLYTYGGGGRMDG